MGHQRTIIIGVLSLLVLVPLFSLRNYSKTLSEYPEALGNPTGDCGVVLTGGPGRVREGIALLSQKRVKKLIISGVHKRSTLRQMFPEILFYPEIPLDNVILERRSTSTSTNAQQSLVLAEALQCHSVLLITSDYHMNRAQKTFAHFFPATVELIAYPVSSNRLFKRPGWLLDTRYWGTVFNEWVKYLFYQVFVF